MIDNVQQKNNSIQGKPEKKASLLLPIIVAAVIFVAMVVSILTSVKSDYREFIIKEDDFKRCFQIESIESDKDTISLEGWCFTLEEDTAVADENKKLKEIEIFLLDASDENAKPIKTNTQSRLPREDVNDYFLCEYDYTYCGFDAVVSTKKIDVFNNTYEILICDDNTSEILIKTGTYICCGDLYPYNPEKFIPPVVEGTDLEEIVNNGIFRTYETDEDIYVYQYENLLYWIAGKTYNFTENNNTFLQYHLYTTQIDKLPQERVNNGYYWDNQSDYFEKHEVTDAINAGDYRVCVREIPSMYSIHSISTGYYDNGQWVWNKTFRPFYDFR